MLFLNKLFIINKAIELMLLNPACKQNIGYRNEVKYFNLFIFTVLKESK